MVFKEIANKLKLTAITEAGDDVEVTGGYASDLLSDVLANAKNGTLWVTNQKHQNIIGVAVMLNLAGVIIAGGMAADENTIEKSKEENIPLYTSDKSLYEIVGEMYQAGVKSCMQ